jgi:hypothetical protein
MGRRLWSQAALLFFLAKSAPVLAEDAAARLDFGSPEGCPQLADFTHEVESRLGRGRLARPGEMARTFHVRVKREAEKSVAKLTFTDADGRIAEREVSGATCEEATRAIAIVTALVIDARAQEEAARNPDPPPVVAPPVQTTPGVLPPPPPPPPQPPPEEPVVFGVGAEGGVERGFAPGFAPRVAGLFELGSGFWQVRIGLSYADSGPVDADDGKARYRLYSARMMFWPIRFQLSDEFSIGFGGGYDVGAIHARGEKSARITNPRSKTQLWFAAELGGRLELAPHPGFAVHIEGLGGFPATRHEFELEPDEIIHRVPNLTASVAVGVIARFR